MIIVLVYCFILLLWWCCEIQFNLGVCMCAGLEMYTTEVTTKGIKCDVDIFCFYVCVCVCVFFFFSFLNQFKP
jgi:hypothetical protein